MHRVWRSPETTGDELERLAGSPDHQGVVAEVDPYPYVDGVELSSEVTNDGFLTIRATNVPANSSVQVAWIVDTNAEREVKAATA